MELDFGAFRLAESLLEGLSSMGFARPTEIQARAIPEVLAGRDLIGSAQTGTGKTAAFLLPIISLLSERGGGNGSPRALVLAPTRELAIQIDQQVEGLGYFTRITSRAVYGGNDGRQWTMQREAIESGADILVATPGRLLQFLTLGINPLGGIEILVLDEADRMLDMGFLPDIMRILEYLPGDRQNLLFSATFPREIEALCKRLLRDPVSINIALSQPAEGIAQYKGFVAEGGQLSGMLSYLEGRDDLQSVVVFAERKVTVREVQSRLSRRGFSVEGIHSDLEQAAREAALDRFRARQSRILVATDIIARGIDIEEIDLVVNYDVPRSAESYVHRIGRTARASSRGEALTLVSASGLPYLDEIERHLGRKIDVVSFASSMEESEVRARGEEGRGGGGSRGGAGGSGRSRSGRSRSGGGGAKGPQGRDGGARPAAREASGSSGGSSGSPRRGRGARRGPRGGKGAGVSGGAGQVA